MKKTTKNTNAAKPAKQTKKVKVLNPTVMANGIAKSVPVGARKEAKPVKSVTPMTAFARLAKKDEVAAELLGYVNDRSLGVMFTEAAERVAKRHDGPVPDDYGKFIPDNLFEVIGEMKRIYDANREECDCLNAKLDYAIIRSPFGVNMYDQYPRKGFWKCVSKGTFADRDQIISELLRILKDDAGYIVKTKGRGKKTYTVLEPVAGKTRKELLKFFGVPENGDPNGLLNKAIGGVNHAYIVVPLDLYLGGDHPNGKVRSSWVLRYMREHGNA